MESGHGPGRPCWGAGTLLSQSQGPLSLPSTDTLGPKEGQPGRKSPFFPGRGNSFIHSKLLINHLLCAKAYLGGGDRIGKGTDSPPPGGPFQVGAGRGLLGEALAFQVEEQVEGVGEEAGGSGWRQMGGASSLGEGL